MRLAHLGLAVRDVARSRAFYETYFGFDPASARTYPDGTVIERDASDSDLAFHHDDVARAPEGFFHFGFGIDQPDGVRSLLARMDSAGVTIVERDDEPNYVSFKCLDPDGYRVEVYWEEIAT
jgi:catechol 2,3-dioxygenase-like lactoylglutathione lyase family enzyme